MLSKLNQFKRLQRKKVFKQVLTDVKDNNGEFHDIEVYYTYYEGCPASKTDPGDDPEVDIKEIKVENEDSLDLSDIFSGSLDSINTKVLEDHEPEDYDPN